MHRFVISAAEDFMTHAANELERLLAPAAVRATALAPGALLVSVARPRDEVLQALRSRPPIFVRHVFPVDAEGPLAGTRDDLRDIATLVRPLLGRAPSGARVAIQARRLAKKLDYTPYAVKETLDPLLVEAGLQPEIRDPEWAVSLALADGRCYIGVSRVADNLSAWAGGMMRFRAGDDDIARSKRKLLEALAVFAVDLRGVRTALDLGAAPGGWTSALVERGIAVTAVDTGRLDERLLQLPQVTFIRENAERLRAPEGAFDLLTCDISWDPLHTARMIVRLAPALRRGGCAIVTVKLMRRRVWATVEAVQNILSQSFVLRGARQLFHNRRETTLFLQRR